MNGKKIILVVTEPGSEPDLDLSWKTRVKSNQGGIRIPPDPKPCSEGKADYLIFETSHLAGPWWPLSRADGRCIRCPSRSCSCRRSAGRCGTGTRLYVKHHFRSLREGEGGWMASITTRFFFFLSFCNLFISQDYFAESMTISLSVFNCFFSYPTLLFFMIKWKHWSVRR